MEEIRALLSRHNFHFSKALGQNFLIESWVPQEIADASGAGAGYGVLEIGPGIGPLTVQLAQRADKVASVELDQTLLPILAETLADYDNVAVIPGDVMKLDLCAYPPFRIWTFFRHHRHDSKRSCPENMCATGSRSVRCFLCIVPILCKNGVPF